MYLTPAEDVTRRMPKKIRDRQKSIDVLIQHEKPQTRAFRIQLLQPPEPRTGHLLAVSIR